MTDKWDELIDAVVENGKELENEHEWRESQRIAAQNNFNTARAALRAAIDEVVRERNDLASRVRELARIISDDGTPDEDLYQSLTEGLPEVAK
ncbi:MAG: hypothetical protein WC107_05745 [Patescibacteria group bacterium]|jgi:predicted  nucleic acid-binding Zn-ribbon protein